jgi:site-specific recombinase XerD
MKVLPGQLSLDLETADAADGSSFRQRGANRGVSDLTRKELVAMLAAHGGIDAIREDYMRDQQYRNTPCGELFGRYLDALEFDEYSEKTISNREQTYAWFCFDYPNLEPHDVTYDLLRGFLEQHWRGAARNTKEMHISALRNAFAWLHDHDLIPQDPARKLKSPRRTETNRRSHSQDVIKKLVLTQDQRRDRIAILMLYWCALRRNELRKVQFTHVDLLRRVLTVFGKGGRVDHINIPEPLALELERYVQDNDPAPEEFLLYPQKIGRTGGFPNWSYDLVWEDRRRPLTQSGIDKWFQRCRERAGLNEGDAKILMHELRHSAGTHAQEAGHDILATKEMLRHRSTATTEQTYLHLDRRREVARVQRLMIDPMADA